MPTTFRPCAPDQSWLFPPSPRDWLPEGHLAFFIADSVAALDLEAFYAPYEGDGRRNQPFDPQMMVTVLLYAYATGTFSSRRIARKLEEDVAYRVLAAGNFPAHRTIADFRQQHLAAFARLFVQVVQLAREAGVGVADDRDQIAMAAGLCPQHAETVLAIMEGDPFDKACQDF